MSIEKAFASHIPTLESIAKVDKLREAYSELKRTIESASLPSRERSIALTELESSAMWATKAVVHHDPSSKAVLG